MIVEGPDGKTIEFPDSMSPADINAAMEQTYGHQQTSQLPAAGLTGPGRLPAMAASGALGGALGAVDSVDSGLSWVDQKLGLDKLLPSWMMQKHQLLPGAENLVNRPELTPQTTAEKYLKAGAEGLGGALALAPFGGGVAGLAAGAAGGVAGQGAEDLLPGNTTAKVTAGLVGGLGVQGSASWLGSKGIEKIAALYGSAKTPQEAGQALQDGAKDWLANTKPQLENQAWDPVNSAMSEKPVDIRNFTDTLQKLDANGGALKNLVSQFGGQMPSKLLDTLNNRTPIGIGFAASWEDARQLRSAIGQSMTDTSIMKDLPMRQKEALYGAITGDLRSSAHLQGPEVAEGFDAANATSSQLNDFTRDHLDKIIGPNAQSPEKVAKSLLTSGKTGGTSLAALREQIPDSVNELTSAHLLAPKLQWGAMSPEAKLALVPDPLHRALIDKAVKAGSSGGAVSDMGDTLKALTGGTIGDHIATGLGSALHIGGSDLVHGAVGAMVGAGLPMLARGAGGIARNPAQLRLPGLGALAGGLDPSYPPKPSN